MENTGKIILKTPVKSINILSDLRQTGYISLHSVKEKKYDVLWIN